MKFKITFQTPNIVDRCVQRVSELYSEQYEEDVLEAEDVIEKFVKNDSITIEFDTDGQSAKVLKC